MKQHKFLWIVLTLWFITFMLPACVNTGGEFAIEPDAGIASGFHPDGLILPDVELVYGLTVKDMDVGAFINKKTGYLSTYQEQVGERWLSGAQIVEEISLLYSVNPRILITLLEMESDWITAASPAYTGRQPLHVNPKLNEGLYAQLSWAANELNRGFYMHEAGALPGVNLGDGSDFTFSHEMNHATASLYYFFGLYKERAAWDLAVSPLGFYGQYVRLFGDPWQYSQVAFIPAGFQQLEMQLPFGQGERWHFTSGPHSAWGDGAAWAALDFSPPGEAWGCYDSPAWVRAVADGSVIYAEYGAVLQDLDGDGDPGTGWVVLYMHIATQGRAAVGSILQQGDVIGHPSCEGGISSGTHLHLARRYNGMWIAADRELPFILSGWRSIGMGVPYEGALMYDDISIEASGYVTNDNEIEW